MTDLYLPFSCCCSSFLSDLLTGRNIELDLGIHTYRCSTSATMATVGQPDSDVSEYNVATFDTKPRCCQVSLHVKLI